MLTGSPRDAGLRTPSCHPERCSSLTWSKGNYSASAGEIRNPSGGWGREEGKGGTPRAADVWGVPATPRTLHVTISKHYPSSDDCQSETRAPN